MHDLVSLYRFALRSGNRRLAAELAAILRRDLELRDQADGRLQALPRGPTRWSAGGERAVRQTLGRLGGFPPDAYDRSVIAEPSESERGAERVLAGVPAWIWDGDTLPVPVEHIADSCFGLHVRDVDDLRSAPGVPNLPGTLGLSGLLLPARGEIWVNAAEARESRPRRRFTISHEVGHWCLHGTGGAVWCRSQAVDPPDDAAEARRAYPPEESEANEFAAALLMPAHLIRRHYERLRRRDPEGTFQTLCTIFEASGAAMSRRLQRVI